MRQVVAHVADDTRQHRLQVACDRSLCGIGVKLYRIAANAIADYTRKLPREANSEPVGVSIADTESNFDESERRASVYRAIESLPDDQKRVIVMRFADEKSIREIAVALGRSEGAVKQLQFRAMENLRGSFSEKANG